MASPSRRLGVLGSALVAMIAPIALAAPASASATANEIVYTADDDNDGIYSVVLRDLASRQLTTVLPADTTNEYIYDEPELSPDGTRIALSTDRGGGSELIEGIAVVDRDGRNFRRLTTPASTANDTETSYALDVSAAWSPDGTELLFTRITVTRPADPAQEQRIDTALFTVPVDGGAASPVTGAEDGYTADWSPDGKKIVFVANADPTTDDSGPLMIVNSDGTGGRTALGPDVVGYSPAWSPDGTTIAYATVTERDDSDLEHHTAKIATVAASGGSPRVLDVTQPTAAPSIAEYPAWAPDGQSLVYDVYGYSTDDAFPPGDLWAVDKDGVRAGRVTATPGDEAQPHVHGPRPSDVSPGEASTYVAVPPQRVMDTREGLSAPQRKLGRMEVLDLTVRGDLPTRGNGSVTVPSNATAVVLNVTVHQPTANTDLRIFPTGTTPSASNLNAAPGRTVPNLVTVVVGAGDQISLRNTDGEAHVFADLAGYYLPGTEGAGFGALEPGRILDTRREGGPVGAAQHVDLRVVGDLPGVGTSSGRTIPVPADATAVVLNVTGTEPTTVTDVRVYPTEKDGGPSGASNLNLVPRQTAPNLVTVAVGEGGKVRLWNSSGAVHLIADIAGYYSPSAPGRFVPVTPARFLDTRIGVGGAPIPVTEKGYVDLRTAGARGVPAGATAAVLNLTATGVSAATHVSAFPAGTSAGVSNLNLTPGGTRANLAIVKTGQDGRVRLQNNSGQLHLIGDLAGYMIG
jgi:Tol biopolymer transport system component